MEVRWYYAVVRYSLALILVGTLIPGIVALFYSLTLPAVYEAQADLLLFKLKTNVTFDARFDTISEDELIRLSGQDPRRQTLATLALSDQVLWDTVDLLPDNLQGNWSVTKLKNRGNVGSIANLLQFSVRGNDAEEARDVANAWALAFTRLTNEAYTQPDEAVEAITEQMAISYGVYESAQDDLEIFLATSRIDELSLELAVKEQIFIDFRQSFLNAGKTTLFDSLVAQEQLPLLKAKAEALRTSMEGVPGTEIIDPTTEIALLLLGANAFRFGAELPSELFSIPESLQLSIQPSSGVRPTYAESLRGLDQLIEVLEALEANLDDIVFENSGNLLAGIPDVLDDEIAAAQAELDRVKVDLEADNAKLIELTAARDQAWENYLTVYNKEAEVIISSSTDQIEVVVAADAIAPENASGPSVAINAALGLAFGFVISLVIAFIRGYLSEDKVRAKYQIDKG